LEPKPAAFDLVLEPADNRRLATLCGQFDQHLRQIERRFGVEINNRGNRFQVIGDDAAVHKAGRVLETLYIEADTGSVTPEQVHLHLQQADAEAAGVVAEAVEPAIPEVTIQTRHGQIRGRGPNQKRYLASIVAHDLNFGIGPAGTGKTYLAVAAAVQALEREQISRIILVRPAVEAGERLGFLPGDMAQKVDPYLRPLYDALYEMLGFERVTKLIERHVIEVAPLAFMRGRTTRRRTPPSSR
jgi:phosphate starvation-inducible PhoH-like protein